MDSTAPIHLVWNLIEDSPKWAYTLPTFHSSCTLRTSQFCSKCGRLRKFDPSMGHYHLSILRYSQSHLQEHFLEFFPKHEAHAWRSPLTRVSETDLRTFASSVKESIEKYNWRWDWLYHCRIQKYGSVYVYIYTHEKIQIYIYIYTTIHIQTYVHIYTYT